MNSERIPLIQETIESEKETAWNGMLKEVDKIADGLDEGVDERIKETVGAFLIHGFTTNGSCEGHMANEEFGLPYPWVEICAPEPEEWNEAEDEEKERLEKEWSIKNLEQQIKMKGFLAEFYNGRKLDLDALDALLVFNAFGAFGGFRVQSFGANMTAILSPEEQQLKLNRYRKEMKDFTEFLKDKYLKQ